MTSNLASGEIAEHALELRNEQRQNKLIENNCKIFYLFYNNFLTFSVFTLFVFII